MDEPPISGQTHLHRYEVHKRLADRLRRRPAVTHVNAKPSPMRPVRLVATVATERLFEQSRPATEATIEIEWRPRAEQDVFRVQYNEPGTPWSCGWHQDDSHPDLGPSHFQVDHEEWATSHREPATFTDPNPMAILETCLAELQTRVPQLPASVE